MQERESIGRGACRDVVALIGSRGGVVQTHS